MCGQSFRASFVYEEPPQAAPGPVTYQPVTDDRTGELPLGVIEAALAGAIPPIMGEKQRNLWLDVAQGCRDAHPDSWSLFDQWQRQSNRYNPKVDSTGWPFTREPSTGSYNVVAGSCQTRRSRLVA